MSRRLFSALFFLWVTLSLAGCEPPTCCLDDGECGEELGCFDGRCSYVCASDAECAPDEVCARPLDGRAAGVCVAPGEDLGECRERHARPGTDGGSSQADAGPVEDAGTLPDVSAGCLPDLYEPNDSRPGATVNVSTPADLTICRFDEDWFRASAEVGQELEVSIDFAFASGDLKLELYGPQPEGSLLVVAPLMGDRRTARHTAVRNGVYAVRVYGGDPDGEQRYTLAMEVRPATDAGDVDAGDVDAGDVDAGALDAGLLDAGDVDAGDLDAGDLDAGPLDAGDVDAGDVDAGALDAGTLDAGDVDAGAPDAGPGVCVDDAFEDNDDRASAALLSLATTSVTGVLCPGDPDVFRLPVTAGETVTLALAYDAPPGMRLTVSRQGQGTLGTSAIGLGFETVTFTSSSSGTVFVRLAAVDTGVARPYQLGIVRSTGGACVDDGFEPNDSLQESSSLAIPGTAIAMSCAGDPDFFQVAPGPRTEITVDLVEATQAGLVLSVVRRSDFTLLAILSADDPPTVVSLGSPPSGPILLIVAGGQDAAYTLSVE